MKTQTDEFNKILDSESDPITQFIMIREYNIKFAGKIKLDRLADLKTRYPEIWKIIEKYRKNRENIFTSIFKSAKKKKLLRENLKPEAAAKIYTNIFNSTFQPEFLLEKNISIAQAIDHMKVIIENGFFNEDGIRRIRELEKNNS